MTIIIHGEAFAQSIIIRGINTISLHLLPTYISATRIFFLISQMHSLVPLHRPFLVFKFLNNIIIAPTFKDELWGDIIKPTNSQHTKIPIPSNPRMQAKETLSSFHSSSAVHTGLRRSNLWTCPTLAVVPSRYSSKCSNSVLHGRLLHQSG